MKLLVGFVCCFLFSETVTFRFLQPSHYSTKLRRIETIVHLVEEEIIVPFHPPVLWQFYSFVKMAAFKERLRVENTLGCSRRPSRAVGKYLGRICEDCFNIYKDYDIFEMCRSDCYRNEYFKGCMKVMLLSKSVVNKAASMVRHLNS